MTGKGFCKSCVNNLINQRRLLRGTAMMLAVIALLLPLVLPPALAEAKTETLTLTTPDSEASRSDNSEKYDYVIIVGVDDLATSVDPLRTWKEQIGYSVKVVTVDYIYENYATGDDAEKIWNYLHDRYLDWGIRYVLLVGDVDVLPMRMLYPDGKAGDGGGYGTDYYYAKLSVSSWDVDGDNRWGEFTDDNLDETPDVLVGRIPFNSPVDVTNICTNIISFEQDTGSWKRNALLAHGMMDYVTSTDKTDAAVLAERLKQDVFDPQGWTVTTLYERGGIAPSSYTCDYPLSQTNFENECGLNAQSVVNCVAHGEGRAMTSFTWTGDFNHNGSWDPDPEEGTAERGSTVFTQMNHIAAHPVSAVVFLCGCSTGPILGDDENFSSSPLRSRYLIRTTRPNMMLKEYLENGAVAVIASTAGSDYRHDWSDPDDATTPAHGAAQSLNYYFYDHLINKDKKVGDAFYDAQLEYADRHALQRGVRVFNFFGDPSLTLKGIENRPGGTDVMIHEGFYYGYAADNADNGDMYVAAIRTAPEQEPGQINVYQSTDHGQSWGTWATVFHDQGLQAIDLVVGDWESGDIHDERVNVFFSDTAGTLWVTRIDFNNPLNQSLEPAIAGGGDWEIPLISAARDPMPMPSGFNLYVAWEVRSPSVGKVRVARSIDNGQTWSNYFTYYDYEMPDIDAGPGGHVYLVAVHIPTPDQLDIKRSTDWGVTWGDWTNLSPAHERDCHFNPSVAASTDPAFPTVWVAYTYFTDQLDEYDLRFAYSADGGSTWSKNRILSADLHAAEGPPDMVGYRAASNRWVNIAYNYLPDHGKFGRNVIWRWASGSLPSNWSAQRIVNDFEGAYTAPRVVYSPGVGPGSGVVYGGLARVNLYFSAPWLTDASSVAEGPDSGGWHEIKWDGHTNGGNLAPDGQYPLTVQTSIDSVSKGLTLKAKGAEQPTQGSSPLIWLETGELEMAFAVSSLFPTGDGVLYASTVTSVDETTNEGVVFRSTDGGKTWERLENLDGCWSLSCVFQSSNGSLFAGGLMVEGDQAYGMLYRSQDGGDTWDTALSFPDGVVCDLIETAEGHLYAATGWNGLLFKSEDGGEGWFPVAELGDNVHIYSIMQASNGNLFLALQGPDGGQIMRSENGEDWIPAEGLDGVEAVYDLIEGGDRLYAGVRGGDMGWVYQSDLEGLSWTPTAELPDSDVTAVHCLLQDSQGQVFAGTEMMPGPSFTRVFVTQSQGEQWKRFGGAIDLANTVYALVEASDMIYASTGYIYGNVYECGMCVATERGDANMDGVVDVFDLIRIKRIVLGLDPPTCGADANQDGEVDVFDLVKIKRIILGLE